MACGDNDANGWGNSTMRACGEQGSRLVRWRDGPTCACSLSMTVEILFRGVEGDDLSVMEFCKGLKSP